MSGHDASAREPFRTFVISLGRAPERRAHMDRLLARLGLSAEFVEAVDGRALTPAQRARYDAAKARRVYGYDMTDAEIACYLSHEAVYARMAAEGVSLALVLEDDIDTAADLAEVVRGLAAEATAPWSVVRLQSSKRSVAEPADRRAFGAPVAAVGARTLCRLETNVLGGCAYLIRLGAARVMLDYGARIFMPIDQTLDRFWENGITPYVVRPLPVWQHAGFSSAIGPRGRERFGRRRAVRQALKQMRRILDSFAKRVFRLALHAPLLGQGLSAVGVRSARLAIRTPLAG